MTTDQVWKPYNVKAIANNVRLVLKTGDVGKLNKPTYEFIHQHMGFIAHYGLQGFQGEYEDLRDLTKNLQTSEMGQDRDHNLKWAKELETESRLTQYGEPNRPYVQSEADAIRAIIAIVREFEAEINEKFGEREKQSDLQQIKALAAKHGITVTV